MYLPATSLSDRPQQPNNTPPRLKEAWKVSRKAHAQGSFAWKRTHCAEQQTDRYRGGTTTDGVEPVACQAFCLYPLRFCDQDTGNGYLPEWELIGPPQIRDVPDDARLNHFDPLRALR